MANIKSSTPRARLLAGALTGFIAATALGFAGAAQAGPLPVLIDFTGDTVGAPPALGGANQPTALFNPAGTTVLVQASANGLATKPVEVTVPTFSTLAGLRYDFDSPVSGQIVRVESTISMNRLFTGTFFQTGASTAPLVTRLIAQTNGDIISADNLGTGGTGPVVGSYAANSPFRIRMDINIGAGNWSFTLDDELNGFADDPIVSGLAFINDPMVIPDVGVLFAALSANPTLDFDFPVSVAYDDISASALGAAPMPEPGTLALFGLGLLGLGLARRRKTA